MRLLAALLRLLLCPVLRSLLWGGVALLRLVAGLLLFLLRLVESAYALAGQQVNGLVLLFPQALLLQRGGLLAVAVHLYHLLGSLCRDGLKVGGEVLVGGVGHHASEYVALEQVVVAVERLQHHLPAWQPSARLHIVVNLVVEAALQFGAHSGELLRIGRYVLEACGVGAHAHEVLHPCGAAQLASAWSRPANAPGLLSRANLLHLDAHVEGLCQHFYELAEVNALVGYVVEYGLVAVALILHVANLHLQSQVLGYLPALDHRLVLARLGLAVFVHVDGSGYSVYALDVVGRLQVGLLYLHLHEPSGQRHHAYVVAGVGLHGHNVALLQVESVHVVVVSLARVLELHLHEVGAELVARHVGQPVVGVQLSVLPSHGVLAQSAVLAAVYLEVVVFVVHCGSLYI